MKSHPKQFLDFNNYCENMTDSSFNLFNEVLNKNWRDNIGSIGSAGCLRPDMDDSCPEMSSINLNKTINKLPNVILTHNLVVPPFSNLPVNPYINPYINNNNIEYVDSIKVQNESIYHSNPIVSLETVDNIFMEDTKEEVVVEENIPDYTVDKRKAYRLKKIKKTSNNHKHIHIQINDCRNVNIERLLSY
jgi:hypothetical protein